MMKILTLLVLVFSLNAFSQNLPPQPDRDVHPGSAHYSFNLKKETVKIDGRNVDVYLPLEAKDRAQKAPIIVFGHGQAITSAGYDLTFIHLARKGFAVFHVAYDNGFMDQQWRRMADDFNSLTAKTIQKYSEFVDPAKLIYAGHSKGAYVALMAAGAPTLKSLNLNVKSLVLFAPAGYDRDYLKNIDADTVVTLLWSDADTVIKQSMITDIYDQLQIPFKQWILVKSYESLKADHFFPLSKSYFFGGRDGVSSLHYHGTWKWLGGAGLDLLGSANKSNEYIYGKETSSSGVPEIIHTVTKNW